jgi:ABC-type multidrug transport system ATPase subunit/peptidoglycan/LPS O-acetylase OafA/YrhL
MSTDDRLHALDAVRAFALLLGVVFHAGFSFIPGMPPGIWAIVDVSPSAALGTLLFTSHIFRMTLFFVIAGFFARTAFHRKGGRAFWADRARRILVPLVVGWIVLAPAVGAIWIWGLTKTFGGTLPVPPADMPPPPAAAFQFMHLWFLYYLFLLYVLVMAARGIVLAVDRHGAVRRVADAAVDRLVRTGAAVLVLPVPLVAALLLHPMWFMWFGIPTPDQSFIPQAASLLGYGTAVAFGWLLHRRVHLLSAFAGQWPFQLGGAVAATVVCLAIGGPSPSLAPAAPGPQTFAFAAGYGIAIWCWTIALIGLALRFLSRPIPAVRYTADASYWIYLAHLPVVVALQVALGHLPWHWSVKLPLILVVSLAVLYASYHYLVRSTFVGQALNGRKYPRRVEREPRSADVGPRSAIDEGAGPSSALIGSLRGVHKKYGSTVALDGFDLEVRQGELLAVLGPNGAGKSTAIAVLLGILEPDRGSVQLLGGSPLDIETRRLVGVMMQDVGLTPELRVRELITLTSSYYANPLGVDETLALTRLDSLARRPYAKLSGGQKRQVQFALAICGRPRPLFLDEPSVGLDVEARETLWGTVRTLVAHGCSIVLTTHYLEEAEALADRVAVMAGGRLVASGTVADIRSLVSRKQITCASTLDPDAVRSWPGVVAAVRDAARLQITVVDAEDVVRRLLATDSGLRDLEIRQAGLAEAFTQLTKEAA